MKSIYTKKAPEPVGPYSQAVEVGNLIFVSGQIAIDAKSGDMVGETIETQTEIVLENIKEILKKAGSDLSSVVKNEIYLKNIKDFLEFNKVYSTYFTKDPKPARVTVEVSNLPKNALVEISSIALKAKKKTKKTKKK